MSKATTSTTNTSTFPPFPAEIIQGVARRFVELYSPIRETPEEFLWLSFLVYFGNAISPYVRLDSQSSEPRFYGVVIGKSGRTRKSAGNNAARDFFKMVEATQRIIEGFGSAEGVLTALGESHLPNPAILYLDELNVLASKIDIAGSIGTAGLHKLFEDHDYDHPLKAKAETITVRNAYLSMIAASTLEDFTNMWSGKHRDTGFFSRLLLVVGDTDKRIARPIDPDREQLAALVQRVKALVSSVANNPLVLKMDPDAEQLWSQFYESMGDGPEWSRIDSYGCRLMAAQAVLRGENSITKVNVQQVIDFLYYEVAVRVVTSPVLAENQLAQMEQLIRKYLPEGKTMRKRDLEHDTNAHRFGIETFRRALGNMVTNEEITVQQKGKSYLYTRVCCAEGDETEAAISEVGVSDVFDSGEDTPQPRKPNETAAFEHESGDRLQFSTPTASEMTM